MGWITQQYEGEVHVVPDHDDPGFHVLSVECECAPVEKDGDPEGPTVPIIVHRDKLTREGMGSSDA